MVDILLLGFAPLVPPLGVLVLAVFVAFVGASALATPALGVLAVTLGLLAVLELAGLADALEATSVAPVGAEAELAASALGASLDADACPSAAEAVGLAVVSSDEAAVSGPASGVGGSS